MKKETGKEILLIPNQLLFGPTRVEPGGVIEVGGVGEG